MTPDDYIFAARVPPSLEPQSFGPWTISRYHAQSWQEMQLLGWSSYTRLQRVSWASLHLEQGEIVMEDSARELRKHLPIWLAAKGRVLVAGLGLGCVVRGLLVNPRVEHIDVVEIDAGILRVVGAEFAGEPRVSLHLGDALKWDQPGARWDYAWHDLWTDGDVHLHGLHAKLFVRFADRVDHQGAWAFPRYIARLMPWRPLGAPNKARIPGVLRQRKRRKAA